MSYILFPLLVIILISQNIESARILAVFPTPSISHRYVYQELINGLLNRGHEMVIITANPSGNTHGNATEIDIGHSYEVMAQLLEKFKHKMKRGVAINIDTNIAKDAHMGRVFFISGLFKHPEVQKLLADKENKFDLVIAESVLTAPLMFAKIFNTSAILFSSLYGFPENYENLGAVSRHPILHPNMFRNKFETLTIWEKIIEIYYEIQLRNVKLKSEVLENGILKTHFGADAPTVDELKEYVELLFVNAHPMFDNNRPVPPGVVYLGGLHLQPVKDLPQDLKEFLDNSKRGVVFVSLGTNVRTSMMDKELLDAFLMGFELLPYDVLWKFDGELEKLPKNLKIQKWFPQRDLLTHPNIKAFVTQGGLQSTDEAIDAGVPLVGIPMMGDQWYNVHKYVKFGIGVQLDVLTLTADDLVNAVQAVTSDDIYRKNIRKLRELMHDQPQQPLERAVWWTEHVLRHGGAHHLRAPAANMDWSEYLMIDVLLVSITVLCVFIFIVYLALRLIYVNLLKLLTVKDKVKRS